MTLNSPRFSMLSDSGEFWLCDHPGCVAKIANHYWGKVKSGGWFFYRRTDECYCPDHIPAWVEEWRAKKKG